MLNLTELLTDELGAVQDEGSDGEYSGDMNVGDALILRLSTQ